MSAQQNSKKSRFVGAISELLIAVSPLLLLLLALWITGKLDSILDRTDLSLLSAVLFADGAFRATKSSLTSKLEITMLLAIGIVGAVACTLAAAFILFAEDLDAVRQLAVLARTGTFTFVAFITSLLYALRVRYVAP